MYLVEDAPLEEVSGRRPIFDNVVALGVLVELLDAGDIPLTQDSQRGACFRWHTTGAHLSVI